MSQPLTHDQLRDRLQEALDFGGGELSLEELVEETKAGRFQCWHNDQAIVFTQIVLRGSGKVLNVYLAAGELEHVLALQPQFLAFGREHGCKVALVHGRMGWKKTLPAHGWSPKYLTWEREL